MKKDVKASISEAAITLFNNKGYNGTTTREIARAADVNIANIAYYFKNKHGLLEHCLMTYFEQYINVIEQGYLLMENYSASETLKEIAKNILFFQSNNNELTRFVLRELSLDSQVNREIMVTYYKKEWFYFKEIFEHGLNSDLNLKSSVNYFIIQFKSLLSMPYLNAHYAKEVLQIIPQEDYFVMKYLDEIEHWINNIFIANCEKELVLK